MRHLDSGKPFDVATQQCVPLCGHRDLAKPHHALLVKDTAIVGCTCGLRFTAEDEAARHQAAVAPKEP